MTSDQAHRGNGHMEMDAGGHVILQHEQKNALGRFVMPALLVVTALFIFRRLQRGNVI